MTALQVSEAQAAAKSNDQLVQDDEKKLLSRRNFLGSGVLAAGAALLSLTPKGWTNRLSQDSPPPTPFSEGMILSEPLTVDKVEAQYPGRLSEEVLQLKSDEGKNVEIPYYVWSSPGFEKGKHPSVLYVEGYMAPSSSLFEGNINIGQYLTKLYEGGTGETGAGPFAMIFFGASTAIPTFSELPPSKAESYQVFENVVNPATQQPETVYVLSDQELVVGKDVQFEYVENKLQAIRLYGSKQLAGMETSLFKDLENKTGSPTHVIAHSAGCTEAVKMFMENSAQNIPVPQKFWFLNPATFSRKDPQSEIPEQQTLDSETKNLWQKFLTVMKYPNLLFWYGENDNTPSVLMLKAEIDSLAQGHTLPMEVISKADHSSFQTFFGEYSSLSRLTAFLKQSEVRSSSFSRRDFFRLKR